MVTDDTLLTHDERKAAEAAFRARPMNPHWSQKAKLVYLEILHITQGRDIVTASASESDIFAVGA